MKGVVLWLIFSIISLASLSQELEVKGIYAASSSVEFHDSFGLCFGINEFVNPKSRIGFCLEYLLNCFPFENKYTADDLTKYIDQVKPHNQKIALTFNCSFNILKKSKSLLFIGPELGLCYIIVNEMIEETSNTFPGNIDHQQHISDHYIRPAMSFGFLVDYELKEVIAHRISVFVSIHPEISGFGESGMMGTSNSAVAGWLNAGIGIRYGFAKKE
jgi:hypothetical protein